MIYSDENLIQAPIIWFLFWDTYQCKSHKLLRGRWRRFRNELMNAVNRLKKSHRSVFLDPSGGRLLVHVIVRTGNHFCFRSRSGRFLCISSSFFCKLVSGLWSLWGGFILIHAVDHSSIENVIRHVSWISHAVYCSILMRAVENEPGFVRKGSVFVYLGKLVSGSWSRSFLIYMPRLTVHERTLLDTPLGSLNVFLERLSDANDCQSW